MKDQITGAAHFQQLVDQVTPAMLFDEGDCFPQTLPLCPPIKSSLAERDDTRVEINIVRQANEIGHIDGHDDLTMVVGVAPHP